MNFRPITENDLAQVLALIGGLATHERRPEAVTATVQDLQTLLFGESPIAYGLVAEDKTEIVGYALMALKFSSFRGKPVLYIEDVFLDSQVRGHGFGQAFMAAISRFATSKGCIAMEWSALDFNESALRFYDALGASVEAGRIHFDGDETFMKKISEESK